MNKQMNKPGNLIYFDAETQAELVEEITTTP